MQRTSSTRHGERVLESVVEPGASVVILGFSGVGQDAWQVLITSGLRLLAMQDPEAALDALSSGATEVVIADAHYGPSLARAVRARPDLACAHIVICAALDSSEQLLDEFRR